MPFYGMTTGSASTRPVQRRPTLPYQAPAATNSGQFSPREMPERFSANDIGGRDVVMESVATAAKAPGYVYERPLAVADTLFNKVTGGKPGDKGPIEQGFDTLLGTPILGDVMRAGGNVIEGSGRLFPGLMNAIPANILKDTINQQPDEILDPLQATMLGTEFIGMSVGDFRKKMEERGFTRADVDDIVRGKRGALDFADKSMSNNRLIDLAGRLIVDPLNATVIMGPAKLAKAAQGVDKLNDLGKATDRLLKLTDARAIVASSRVLSVPPKGVRAGVAAIRAGVSEGVTNQSLGVFLMGAGRGSSALLGSYRKLAVGTTGVQLGANMVLDELTDNSAVPGPLNDLYILGREIAENKPLSDGMLFSLWAVTHFPARAMAGTVTDKARGKIRYWSPKGSDIEARLVDLLVPGERGAYAARRAEMIDKLGGADSLLDLIRHIHGKSVAPLLAKSLTDRPVLHGMIDTMEHARMVNELADDAVRANAISGREAVDLLKEWATGARNVNELAHGLDARFTPETVFQQWNAFRSVASRMEGVAAGAVVPEIKKVLIREHLQVAQTRFRQAAASNGGKVKRDDAQRILLDNPALLTHDTAGFWAKMLIRDAEDMPLRWIEQRIKAAQKDSVDLVDVIAPETEWAARRGREAMHRAGFTKPDGTLDYSRMPTAGDVRIMAPTARNIARRDGDHLVEDLQEVYEQRASGRAGRLTDADEIAVYDEAGYPVTGVKEGISGQHGEAAPAAEYTLSPHAGPQQAAEVGALAIRRAGSNGHARSVISGNSIDAHGLTANANEASWVIGPHGEAAKQEAFDLLNRHFDDVYVDDTAGVYRVYVGLGSSPTITMQELNTRMGAIFPDKATLGGTFDGSVARVWTETIRDTSKGRTERAARAAGTQRSLHDVERTARLSTNWHVASNRFRERDQLPDVGGRGGVGSQPGPVAGPVREAPPAGEPGVGAGNAGPGGLAGDPNQPVSRKYGQDMTPDERRAAFDTWGGVLMRRSDPMVKRVLDATFPGYKGRKIRIRKWTGPRTLNSYWDGGSRSEWRIIDREKGVASTTEDMANPFTGSAHEKFDLPEGQVAIEHEMFQGQDMGITIYMRDLPPESPRLGSGIASPDVPPGAAGATQTPASAAATSLDQLEGFTPQDASANKGQLKWMQDRDAELGQFKPNMGKSVTDRFDDVEQTQLHLLQEELTRYDPTYTIGVGPKDATPFRIGQGKAYATAQPQTALKPYVKAAMAKQAAGDLLKYAVTSRTANFWHTLFGRVYTSKLSNDAKQELFSDLITAGASPAEVNSFFKALSIEAKSSRTGITSKGQLWHRMDLLPPEQIDMIANGIKVVGEDGQAIFRGFDAKVIAAVGPQGFHKAMTRASSRFYRKLEQDHRAKDGLGSLTGLLDKTYGPMTKAADGRVGRAGNAIRAYYPLLRFKLDPRWHLMNWLEADIIGAARYGIRGRDFSGLHTPIREASPADARAVARISGREMDAATAADNMASGFLDARRLEAYIGPAFRSERVQSTRAALVALADNDPIMVTLRKRFGKPGATADDLVDELDDMMYQFDTIGVKGTIDNTIESARTIDGIDYNVPEMKEIIQQLTKVHKQNFSDVVHSFHGNVNRSNMERMANNYFLYWPISYQLKVAKSLVDVLTKSFGGRKTDLLGAWTLNRMMDEHKRRLLDDPGYRAMFEEHPEMWRAAAMFLPITPFDMGVSAARLTRYAASSAGAALGFWGKDDDYPDMTTPAGLADAAQRIGNLGLPYTLDMLGRVSRETFKE